MSEPASASDSASTRPNPAQDKAEQKELHLLSEEMIGRVRLHSGTKEARKLRALVRARDLVRIQPARKRLLGALAAAAGEPDIWQWAAKLILSTTRSSGDWFEDFVFREWDPIEVAQRICIYAWPMNFPPFDRPDPKTWSRKAFDAAIREYINREVDPAEDCVPFTRQDRKMIRDLTLLALAHEGRRARQLGAKMAREWGTAQSRGGTMMPPWMIDAM